MASININNLQPAGSDLFNDSESYLNELNKQEIDFVNGGYSYTTSLDSPPIIVITPPKF